MSEPTFTKSIKQQNNRHQCGVCGVVGCVEHTPPKQKRPPVSKTTERINRTAREIAARNGEASGQSALAGKFGARIRRVLDQFDDDKWRRSWHRKSTDERVRYVQQFQDTVDQFEKLNQSHRAKELISRARFKIKQWRDG